MNMISTIVWAIIYVLLCLAIEESETYKCNLFRINFFLRFMLGFSIVQLIFYGVLQI